MGWKKRMQEVRGTTSSGRGAKTTTTKEATEPCNINGCGNWADKHLGGRSLGVPDAEEVWGSGGFSETKGRVKVCKSCYRHYKKEQKDNPAITEAHRTSATLDVVNGTWSGQAVSIQRATVLRAP